MDQITDWLAKNKDLIDTILNILKFIIPGGAVLGLAAWFIRWLWARRLRIPVFPFHVITQSKDVLPTLLPGEAPLADCAIPYEQRVADRDVQHEMRGKLAETRYLLIRGKRGLGKTREAGMLAKALCDEGATVLILRRDGWLDVPRDWPEGLINKNLLFFIDDLNFHCAKRAESPKAENMIFAPQPSFQDRLLCTLDWFEDACGEKEIRVIAAARDEADEWAKLGYSEDDPLWRRFVRYDLPLPEATAIENLLTAVTEEKDIPCDRMEFPQIAAINDHTMHNVVENLRLALQRGGLTLMGYRPTLDGTYEDSYRAVVRSHPACAYVYDALDILQQVEVTLYVSLVVDLAAHLWSRNPLVWLWRRRQVSQAIDYLVCSRVMPQAGRVLAPRDGQIEGKGYMTPYQPHLKALTEMVLAAGRQYGIALRASLDNLGVLLVVGLEIDAARKVSDSAIKLDPNDHLTYNNRGLVYALKGEYDLAMADFDRAIELKPDLAQAYNNRGFAYALKGEYDLAIADLDRAIELKPDSAEAYYNRGAAYRHKGEHDQAIADFDRAIELKPDFAEAYNNRGAAYRHKGEYDLAMADFDRAIELEPDYAGAYNNRGFAYYYKGDYALAIADFDRAIELRPDLAEAYVNRGNAYYDKGEYDLAIADFDKAIELRPDLAEAYVNRGLVHKMKGEKEKAIRDFERVLELSEDEDKEAEEQLRELRGQ